MKRFDKCKRILAFLLVTLMIISQSSVITLAEELSLDTQNAQNQETIAETPEESEQEPSVSDSDNIENQEPAEEQPSAPEENAEITAAPTVTEIPATTETPEATVEATENTQEEASDEKTEVSEPTVTEAPLQTTTKTEFAENVDNAFANVKLSQPISDKAVFVAKQYNVESDYFTNNAEAAMTQWASDNKLTVLSAVAYDMHFEENEQELSVTQHADVNMTFSSPILAETGDTGVTANTYVLHIINGQAVSAGTVTQNANGAVTAAQISTEGFSPFVFVKAVSGEAVQTTEAGYDTELQHFVNNVSLKEENGNDILQENGVYQLRPETNYKLALSFRENKNLQFANNEDGKLYYTLPAGVTIPAEIPPTNFTIGELTGNTFRYPASDGSNRIEVQINTNGGEKYNDFKGSGEAFFDLEFNVQFQTNIEQIVFGNTKSVKVYVDATNGLKLEKSAKYDKDKGTVSYTVKVTSTGINENVIVTDNLSGNWLKMYELKDVSIKSSKNKNLEVTKSISGRIMTVAIPTMTHNEVITIGYTVQVDYDKVTPASPEVIKENTRNTVSVNHEGVDSVSVSPNIAYAPKIEKNASVDKTTNEITYTITLNADYRYDISGKKITDEIAAAARKYGKYSGKGIKVVRYDSRNTVIDITDVPWSAITADKSKDYTWAYTIPSDHSGKYKYVITYTVQGENHEITGATIANTVSYDEGGSVTYWGNGARVEPLDGVLAVQKKGSIVADDNGRKQIKWNVTFNIPAGKEYTNCSITDTLPSVKIDNKTYADSYVNGSAEITESVEGSDASHKIEEEDAYTIAYSGNTLTVKFKDLGISDKNRTIKFSYLTNVNETWLQNSTVSKNYRHTNSAKVTARGQNKSASAYVDIYENNPEISKTAKVNKKDSSGNAEIIKYEIAVSGIEGEQIEITDEFNTKQLKLDKDKGFKVKYSDDGKNYSNDRTAEVKTEGTEKGLKFIISNFHKNGENNHKYYKLTYYLKVTDLESIETSSEGGIVQNKATFRGESETVDTKVVGTPGIIKKELLNEPTIQEDKFIAEYKLTINPGKKQYGKSDTLVVEDKMTNMTAIKRDDVKVETVPESNKDKVTAVFKEDGIDFTVPNATEVIITYKAKWTGNGNVDHTNEVTVYGYSKNVKKTATVSSQGSGGYSNLHLTIYKVEDGNDIKLLSGAKFSLEIYENGEYIPVRERNGDPVTITTEENGKAVLQGHEGDRGWVLWKDYKYRLIETKAPDGYILDSTPHEFTFSQELAANDPNVTYCENGGELTIKNKPIEIEISKVSLTGNEELEGASLQITKDNDDTFKAITWKSGDDGKNEDGTVKTHTVKLTAGTYTLSEETAPTGYDIANPITFTVNLDGTVTSTTAGAVDGKKVTMKDALKEREIEISKVDLTNNTELAGAKLQITKDNDDTFEAIKWTSGDDGKNEDGTVKTHTVKLTAGTYTLSEETAPTGYDTANPIIFTVNLDGTVTSTTAEAVDGKKVTMKDALTEREIEISKVSLTGNEELEGAELKITKGTDGNGEPVASWTSGKEVEDKNEDGSAKPHKVKLVAGTYTLSEETAPTGYDTANPITFTVNLDGTVTSTTAGAVDGKKVTMKDALTEREIEISKVSLTGNKELEGASLQITKDNDDTFKAITWTSGDDGKNEDGTVKTHTVKLTAGTYTLSEETAPTGYDTANPITFTVNLDGTVTSTTAGAVDGKKVTMKDALKEREIEISKVDAADGVTELAGAKLQITDEAGNIVKDKAGNELSWTTGESAEDQNEDGSAKPHKVKLVAGTYILKEVSAPFGYLMADPITFTVGLDGKLSSKAEGAVSNDENKAVVIMKDVAKEKSVSSSISVTKRLKTVAGEDILATDQTFYVALYADQECTQRVSDVKALTFKMDSVSTATFTDLAIDTTYYIGECTADGVNYLRGQTADGTTYTAMFSNGNSVETGSNGGNKAVEFENRFVKFPDGFYKEALLNLTKQLKNSDGKDKNSDETFYAGIFADKDYTKLSDQVSQNIVPLNLNGNSSAGAQIKVAIADGGSTTLYVTEVDADGKPVENADSFEYDLSVDTESITFNESNKSASVTLVNQERAEDEDEETEEEEIKEKTTKNTPTPTSSVTPTKSTQTTNAVKTGDNTPIGIFVVLLIAAIAVIGGGIYLKRRKK